MNYNSNFEKNFNEMIDKYGKTVYKVAFSYCRNQSDADDIYQDVFIRYFKKMPLFENETHAKAWFIRVTVNCCKSLVTSSWSKKITSLDFVCEQSTVMEEKSDLFYAVLNLPIKYREVIHLHYYENYSIKEIASILGRSETAVGTQLQRGRKLLKIDLCEEVMA